MAKRKKESNLMPTLNKTVPYVVVYLVLIALYFASVKIAQMAVNSY